MRKLILAAAALSATAPVLTAPAAAQRYDRGGYDRYYDRQGYYQGPTWRGQDGRMYCRRSNGTTGLIVGGAAGALIGRAIDTRGERTTGTILGAAAGALLGREVQKGRSQCR
jgi:hypothetical protein